MEYFAYSPSTEQPSSNNCRKLYSLDFAYLVVLPPVVLLLKLPMLFFLAIAIFLSLRRRPVGLFGLTLLFLLGIGALFLSLFGAFNFDGMTKLYRYLELLTDLFIVAIVLQRLTCQVNFYLVISPIILLALSLFFFQKLWMLGYLFIAMFLLLWITIHHFLGGDVGQSLRQTTIFYLASLPLTVTLFILFPRISFGQAAFGFRSEAKGAVGFDGGMRLDAGALELSRKIVMEVDFEHRIPPENDLYFRGSVLYIPSGKIWRPLPEKLHRKLPSVAYAAPMLEASRQIVIYKIYLYPTYRRWLYLLDLPIEAPKGARIDGDFEVMLSKPIDRPQIYEGASALTYRYGAQTPESILRLSLKTDPRANPLTAAVAQKLRRRWRDPARRLDALKRFFASRRLTYTLAPPSFDYRHFTDDFLFRKKRGYCVHFAASFVTMARLAGLPARIVTGYKADYTNRIKNYIAVEERDAHAWAEVMVHRRWMRVETTALAHTVERSASIALPPAAVAIAKNTKVEADRSLSKIDLYLLYAKFRLQTWILRYNRYRQMQLLQTIEKRPILLAQIGGTLLLSIIIAWLVIYRLTRNAPEERTVRILTPLLRRLEREGLTPYDDETIYDYLIRCASPMDTRTKRALIAIAKIYRQIRYGGRSSREKVLKKLVRQCKRARKKDR